MTPSPTSTQVSEDSVDSIQGANPFVGLTAGQVALAAGRWASALAKQPAVLGAGVATWASKESDVILGRSLVEADKRDRRFSDPIWQGPLWRRVLQSYIVTRESLFDTVNRLELDPKSSDRARFALMQLTEAAAPTNNLLTNPVALREAGRSRGRSLVAGGRHFLWDMKNNGGLPSQVDTRPFTLGETTAATPGAVIHRTPLFELIHFSPTTSSVAALPLVLIPPQINRYYVLDLAPGRSLVEHAVNNGLQVFLISWRNPESRHRHWSLDDYAESCIEAMKVAAGVAGTEQVNIAAFCSGGMTASAVLAHLAEREDNLVNAASLAVTMIDSDVHSTLNMFATEKTLATAVERSTRAGVLRGDALAKMFAFVRPNDLVWNYFVSNYLMGESPPAFDVLAWNKDTTNLPARLHADFINMWIDNALMHPGSLRVLGTFVDLAKVPNDMYVVGAMTDHLVPWHSAYAATQAFGGDVRYVLSNSGHIQALINPPGNPKANYFAGDATPADPGDWLKAATRTDGTWWDDWVEWLKSRSGESRPAPTELGSSRYLPVEPAPGRYVRQ